MLFLEKAQEIVRYVDRKEVEEFLGKPVGFVKKEEENGMKVNFEKRGVLEEDETKLQVIPYVLIRTNEGILAYVRSGSERRLFRKISIGFGGHSSSKDVDIRQTARREISEEISVNAEPSEMKFIGYIFSDTDEVSRVHVGYVYLYNFDGSVDTLKPSEEIERLCFYKGILECEGELENWSRILIERGIVKELVRW